MVDYRASNVFRYAFNAIYNLMTTKIQIVSNALVLIGDSPISDFTENDAAAAGQQLYPFSYNNVLSRHPWGFAKKYQQLSKLSQTPESLLPWFRNYAS